MESYGRGGNRTLHKTGSATTDGRGRATKTVASSRGRGGRRPVAAGQRSNVAGRVLGPAPLSVAQVARLLRCSAAKVRRLIHQGPLEAVREFGRLWVTREALAAVRC